MIFLWALLYVKCPRSFPVLTLSPSLFLSPPVLMHDGLICITFRPSGFCLGLRDLCCVPPQWYRTTLYTTDLRCAPLTWIVHHDNNSHLLRYRPFVSNCQPLSRYSDEGLWHWHVGSHQHQSFIFFMVRKNVLFAWGYGRWPRSFHSQRMCFPFYV